MRRIGCVCLLVLLCLIVSACAKDTAVGVWTALEPSAYYFELYEDGTCVMFDAQDEWVSSGTYREFDTHITFETDTGSFLWVWDEASESMLFEAGNGVFHYRQSE